MAPAVLLADINLPSIIADHMVLQRETSVPIWGWTKPGETVTVSFAGQERYAQADGKGRWEALLDPMEASTRGRTLRIATQPSGFIREIRDILVGEVWLVSFQGMDLPLRQSPTREFLHVKELDPLEAARIRCYLADRQEGGFPLPDASGQWITGERLQRAGQVSMKWSGTGYFFANKLQHELEVPVAYLEIRWLKQEMDRFIPDEGYAIAGLDFSSAAEANEARYRNAVVEYAREFDRFRTDAERGIHRPAPFPPRTGQASNATFNGMIAPVAPFAIRGMLWNSSFTDVGKPDYFDKILALSAGYSTVFRLDPIPLLMGPTLTRHLDWGWKERSRDSRVCNANWTAQYRAEDEIPGVMLVPVFDAMIQDREEGTFMRQFVGERFAEMALSRVYRQPGYPKKAPRFKTARRVDNKVLVSFEGAGAGLTTFAVDSETDQVVETDAISPAHFELSVDGETFIEVSAEIRNSEVALSVPDGMSANYVRMGWYGDVMPNLKARGGWSVLPFPAQHIK